MDRLFPLPLYRLLKTANQNGGFSMQAFRNLPAWLLKTILFEPIRWYELLAYNKRIREHQIEKPPVFILGYYRSGTTYLQETFIQDARFGYLNNFQQILPEIMLSSEGWLKPLLSGITGALNVQNKMHRIPLSWDFPGEEDVAMTTSGHHTGAYWGYFLPRMNEEQFRKFTLFESASDQEKNDWLNQYVYLLKKISLANKGKQLLLKTPPNMARVRLLLSAFPDAKFIFIHRNPYDVYSSNKRLWKVVQEIYTLGKTDTLNVDQTILEQYAAMTENYLNTKDLIPAEQLVELRYADFAADPVNEMRKIYETLNLHSFHECENRMAQFANRKKDYAVLKHQLSDTEIDMINKKWGRFINHWDYHYPDKT